ncbi:MAG: sulfurtransferase [Bacteroidales bacterium]|jgi:thiosulfate/3-mercaptopyruvate sulfurtransferase|nr:sulfurtransferase [Bacteroidales bacterium]
MNAIKKVQILIIAFLFILPSAFAQVDFISVKDYMTKMKSDKNMVTLHTGAAKDYQRVHIRRSIFVSYKETEKTGDVKGLMQDASELATLLGKKGVSNTNTIVVYDGGSQKYSNRVYWLLKYLGASDVKVLHKDLNTWRKSRVPLTAVPVKGKATTFAASVNTNVLANTADVKKAIDNANYVIVDARAKSEFDGSDGQSKGHIKSAINIDYKELLTASGAFKTKEEIKAIADAAGITAGKEVILYCQTSIRGAVSYFAFKNVLGLENVKLYDGAIEEWQVANTLTK